MVPGNYVKIIPEPSGGAGGAAAPAVPPAKPESKPATSADKAAAMAAAAAAAAAAPVAKQSNANNLDDALARASRRRQMTPAELESENTLKVERAADDGVVLFANGTPNRSVFRSWRTS
jgi:hypothetical protein